MSDREDKCPDPVPAALPKVEPKPPAAESIVHAMSDREELIEQAVDAVARSIDPYAFARAGDERYEHFRLDARKEARRRVEAAAPFLESSPAPEQDARIETHGGYSYLKVRCADELAEGLTDWQECEAFRFSPTHDGSCVLEVRANRSPAPDEVVVKREDLASLLNTYDRPANDVTRRLRRAVIESEDARPRAGGWGMTGQIVPGGIIAAAIIISALSVLWWGK